MSIRKLCSMYSQYVCRKHYSVVEAYSAYSYEFLYSSTHGNKTCNPIKPSFESNEMYDIDTTFKGMR